MPEFDSRLDDLARQLLDAVVAYYPAEGAQALPDRRYVADATPAWDCAQVTVQLLRTFPCAGDPNIEIAVTVDSFVQWAAEYAVQIVRCRAVPNDAGDPPSVEEIEDNALAVHLDAMAVFDAAMVAYRAGDLAGCGGVGFGGWTAAEPSDLTGGLAVLRLIVE